MRSLVERWPALARLPRVPLASLPTPVARASALSAAIGAEIWIKRDDLTAARYGGNKVRKLEPLLGFAQAQGMRTIVTMGALGSHHVLATALYGRDLGVHVMAALLPQPVTDHVRDNLKAILALGVEVVPVSGIAGLVAATTRLIARATRRDGRRPFVVGPGGSSALGSIGYVDAALELAGQIERGEAPPFDHVFVAFGSGGTAGGALAGMRVAGLRAELHAVVVADGARIGASGIRWLGRGALKRLRRIEPAVPAPALEGLTVDASALGPGYGEETPDAREAIELAARLEGLTLEPTYTGKTLASLLRAARGPLRGERLLYWHTLSGTPAHELALPEPQIPESLRATLG